MTDRALLTAIALMNAVGLWLAVRPRKYFEKPSARNDRLLPKQNDPGGTILDSCALIDGRIADIYRTGFAPRPLYIPNFIVSELQLLADGNDAQKRMRARGGLETILALQTSHPDSVHVVAWEQDRTSNNTTDTVNTSVVDDKLLAMTLAYGAHLCTTDSNLQKIAQISHVTVLNPNELAMAVRRIFLPGEIVSLTLTSKGESRGQASGYLQDGTLVIVDGAAKYIGRRVEAKVTKLHQTTSGRMVFARLVTAAST